MKSIGFNDFILLRGNASLGILINSCKHISFNSLSLFRALGFSFGIHTKVDKLYNKFSLYALTENNTLLKIGSLN